MPADVAIRVRVDGRAVDVRPDTTVAVAILEHTSAFRRSTTGTMRGPLCGMGVCFECRVTIDGRAHQRSCQIVCRSGMEICTDAS